MLAGMMVVQQLLLLVLAVGGAAAFVAAVHPSFIDPPEQRFLREWDEEQKYLWIKQVKGQINPQARL